MKVDIVIKIESQPTHLGVGKRDMVFVIVLSDFDGKKVDKRAG